MLAIEGAQHDLVAALVFCNAGPVDLSVINGEIIVRDGKLLTIDLEARSPLLYASLPNSYARLSE